MNDCYLQWFPLEGVPHGEVRLKLQWFALKDDPSLPTEVTSVMPAAFPFIFTLGTFRLPFYTASTNSWQQWCLLVKLVIIFFIITLNYLINRRPSIFFLSPLVLDKRWSLSQLS